MNEQQRVEHNRAFEEAAALVKDEIPLHERPAMPEPGWWLRRKLNRAISLFERVLALNPDNWSAMWLVGKVHQRLGDFATALSWFERSYQINPSQPDVAREAAMCAMDIGRHDAAGASGRVQLHPVQGLRQRVPSRHEPLSRAVCPRCRTLEDRSGTGHGDHGGTGHLPR